MGDLLFPNFNKIVPVFVESVLPSLKTAQVSEQVTLLETFYNLLSFAFKTQIFEKKLPNALKQSKQQEEGESSINISKAFNNNEDLEIQHGRHVPYKMSF